MALGMPIPACEHSTFAIGRRAPRGVSVLGLGAAAQEQIAGMGLVRRFQQAPDVLLRTVPRRPARRGIVFTAFSRRRVGLRGAQETIRDPAREANFFGFPGTASSRQRLFCGTGLSPPAPHLQVRPFEPWCEPTRARCICVATGVCDFAASASRRRPLCPQSARLSDARVTLTGDDIAPSADLGISRRPSPPQASTRTLRTDFQMGASIPTFATSSAGLVRPLRPCPPSRWPCRDGISLPETPSGVGRRLCPTIRLRRP